MIQKHHKNNSAMKKSKFNKFNIFALIACTAAIFIREYNIVFCKNEIINTDINYYLGVLLSFMGVYSLSLYLTNGERKLYMLKKCILFYIVFICIMRVIAMITIYFIGVHKSPL